MPGDPGPIYYCDPARRTVIVRLGHQRSSQFVNNLPEEVDALINWGKQFTIVIVHLRHA